MSDLGAQLGLGAHRLGLDQDRRHFGFQSGDQRMAGLVQEALDLQGLLEAGVGLDVVAAGLHQLGPVFEDTSRAASRSGNFRASSSARSKWAARDVEVAQHAFDLPELDLGTAPPAGCRVRKAFSACRSAAVAALRPGIGLNWLRWFSASRRRASAKTSASAPVFLR